MPRRDHPERAPGGEKAILGQKALLAAIADEKKRSRALDIAAALRTPGLFPELKKTPFALRGIDLLRTEPWQTTGKMKTARRVGANVRLPPLATLSFQPLPEWMQEGSYTIKARVLVRSSGARISIHMDLGDKKPLWPLDAKDAEWVAASADGKRATAPLKLGTWTEVTLAVTDKSEERGGSGRFVRFSVDGKVLPLNGTLDGLLAELRFATTEGEITVGGIEVVK